MQAIDPPPPTAEPECPLLLWLKHRGELSLEERLARMESRFEEEYGVELDEPGSVMGRVLWLENWLDQMTRHGDNLGKRLDRLEAEFDRRLGQDSSILATFR